MTKKTADKKGKQHPCPRVLVVDDEQSLRLLVSAVLHEEGWTVMEADSAEAALKIVPGADVHVVLLDMRMPGMDGLDALAAVRKAVPDVPVVMLTAFGTVGSAVEAMKRGAFDYLTKPADNEELKAVLNKAVRHFHLVRENRCLREEVGRSAAAGQLLGQSAAMVMVRERIEQAGPSLATVLILGESGTGKELVARALHMASDRSHGPLVQVNCAALPVDLLESELFGYVRGAFTGAVANKPGRFQMARGGTLVLDEIGEMPLLLQAKLLRTLQERIVEPLGSVESVPVDVRIVAATNRDIQAMVDAGEFREDLYFRLNVLEITIPPLRERMEDIPVLARHLLRHLSEKNSKTVREMSTDFMAALGEYHWPGNVRELENVLERALILSRTDSLQQADLPAHVLSGKQGTASLSSAVPETPEKDAAHCPALSSLEAAEKHTILDALAKHNGHREKTAAVLGISRRALQYKISKYNLPRRG